MIFIIIGISLFCSLYSVFILLITTGLKKSFANNSKIKPFVTILVPARNEEEYIKECLNSLIAQDYPKDKMEIIVLNDASADNTESIVNEIIQENPFVRIININEENRSKAPKKEAIERGVKESKGEIIFSIDGDCTASPNWISATLKYFTPDTGVVFGWVGVLGKSGLFNKLQAIEYLSILGIAAGFTGLGKPTMGNANNFAYRKRAFEEVNGFEGINNVTSGDDELLIQKISDTTNWKVAFCADTLNLTAPSSNVFSFLNQRSRWASKGVIYKRIWLNIFLFALFFYYALFYAVPMGAFLYPVLLKVLAFMFGAKLLVDLPLVLWSLYKTKKIHLIKYFLFSELFQVFYIPLVSVFGTFGLFKWKDKRS